ncbi:hypothetical protein [Rhodoblastus sp.]|nr:hypothetical protein [Rhodoblastus sp.]
MIDAATRLLRQRDPLTAEKLARLDYLGWSGAAVPPADLRDSEKNETS